VTAVALLALLVVVDGAFSGFRVAAGCNGRIGKRAYYAAATLRGAGVSTALLAVNVLIAWLLVRSAADPASTWTRFQEAATVLVRVYGAYATLTLGTLVFYVLPIGEYRLLTSVLVLGPMTLIRPLVIVVGLVLAVADGHEPRVAIMAVFAGVTALGCERWLRRRYANAWRSLTGRQKCREPSRTFTPSS
jgi:hypothetical protein